MTTAIPPAAVAVIAAALEDHRLVTDPATDTPHAAAGDIAHYLASSGYAIVPARPSTERTEAVLPWLLTTVVVLLAISAAAWRLG